ncbi:MAG: rhombosortase [Gammaproteobacteria bacterium]|nr:rhombosortase [Gammaproteobacteria bacterium]
MLIPAHRAGLRLALVCIGVSAVSLFATLLTVSGNDAWLYQRESLLSGQWWHLLTAHFAHANFAHWALNMAGLAIIAAIYRREATASSLITVTGVLTLWVSAALLLLHPELVWYLGFSGVLHGVFAYYALRAVLAGERVQLAALAMLGSKLAYEHGFGPASATQTLIGVPVVAEAHLYGAVGGFLIAVGMHASRIRRLTTTD